MKSPVHFCCHLPKGCSQKAYVRTFCIVKYHRERGFDLHRGHSNDGSSTQEYKHKYKQSLMRDFQT